MYSDGPAPSPSPRHGDPRASIAAEVAARAAEAAWDAWEEGEDDDMRDVLDNLALRHGDRLRR